MAIKHYRDETKRVDYFPGNIFLLRGRTVENCWLQLSLATGEVKLLPIVAAAYDFFSSSFDEEKKAAHHRRNKICFVPSLQDN